jgi:succinate dehydrogenase / fumarate reductase flavoprotein subunit
MVESIDYDLIICGSGLAGLRAALAAAQKNSKLKIAVVSKVQVMRSHSVSAEGGTAAVLFPEQIRMLQKDFAMKCLNKSIN